MSSSQLPAPFLSVRLTRFLPGYCRYPAEYSPGSFEWVHQSVFTSACPMVSPPSAFAVRCRYRLISTTRPGTADFLVFVHYAFVYHTIPSPPKSSLISYFVLSCSRSFFFRPSDFLSRIFLVHFSRFARVRENILTGFTISILLIVTPRTWRFCVSVFTL